MAVTSLVLAHSNSEKTKPHSLSEAAQPALGLHGTDKAATVTFFLQRTPVITVTRGFSPAVYTHTAGLQDATLPLTADVSCY